jgi:hypothetical protein
MHTASADHQHVVNYRAADRPAQYSCLHLPRDCDDAADERPLAAPVLRMQA